MKVLELGLGKHAMMNVDIDGRHCFVVLEDEGTNNQGEKLKKYQSGQRIDVKKFHGIVIKFENEKGLDQTIEYLQRIKELFQEDRTRVKLVSGTRVKSMNA